MTDTTVPSRPDSSDDDLIDLSQLLTVFRRRFWTLIAVGALVFTTVAVVTLQMTPKYTAVSSVLLNVRQARVVDIEAVLSGMAPDSAMVDTEAEVLRSRALVGAVVDRMDLVSVPEFNADLQEPGLVDAIRSSLAGFVRALVPAGGRALAQDEEEQQVRERVISALKEAVSIRRSGLTYVVNISVTSENPSLARDIANTYGDLYLLTQLEAKFEATERANVWLNERVDTLREEVRVREQAVAQYREQAGLIDAQGSTIAEQQVADLNSQLAIQRAERAESLARLNAVRSQLDRGVSADTIGEVLRSSTIQDLRRQLAEVTRRQAELLSRYGPRHPQILTARRELADIEDQIDREIQRIVASLENEVNIANQRVRSLEQSLSETRGELAQNNSAIVRLRELEREAEASRALFESFLNRFRQTSEADGLAEADARIVSAASLPLAPSAPNLMLNLALGLVLAGVAGVGVVFVLEMLDNGLNSEADIERQLGVAHIASVPLIKAGLLKRLGGNSGGADPGQYVVDKPLSSFAEAFRTIKSAIRVSAIDDTAQVVAITSAVPGEGKTTLSLCLGRVSAMAGARVIVVDTDLRRRLLTKALAPDVPAGLLEVLSGSVDLDAAIATDEATPLHFLPLRDATFTPQDVFSSRGFGELLDTLRERYDQIILDTAPVLAVADTRVIASQADAVVVTARWRKSSVNIVRRALQELRASKARVLGVTLNGVDMEAQARYGYDTSGYYYRSYRKYYSN
ncbi:polysaccharide biosynthesis tyrosine autokinase [Hyphomonadaceae bacterium BL14]|nr:polysaccharide biosynthesis tyrosine autokinase [Hyphomonadaceae bacterium BL14]